MSITQYFSRLPRYWQQLNTFETTKWDCPTDAVKYKKIVEKKRIYKFLLGLNKDLDEVRGRILGTKSLPNIREIASEVRREESRKKVMLGTQTSQPVTTTSPSSIPLIYKQTLQKPKTSQST